MQDRAAGAWASDDGEAGSTHGASELMDLEPEPDAGTGTADDPQQAPEAPAAGALDAAASAASPDGAGRRPTMG